MSPERKILCVNVDHIATLRQARGGSEPDPVTGARICEESGADGITVHLREDRRHIQDRDVFELKKSVKGKFNLEMALSPDIIGVATGVVPHQVTIVPERREELTTEGGLDVAGNMKRISELTRHFRGLGVLVSLFVEPDTDVIKRSFDCGADYVEIHTGTYCNAADAGDVKRETDRIYKAAICAVEIGIRVNAGHGLNAENLPALLNMPGLEELNIGHSIISRSIYHGLPKAVGDILAVMRAV